MFNKVRFKEHLWHTEIDVPEKSSVAQYIIEAGHKQGLG